MDKKRSLASIQGRQAVAALAVICAALAVCAVALSLRDSLPGKSVLVADNDGSEFRSKWKSWLGKVNTQVDAALHVSKGLPVEKRVQLDQILQNDLEEDLKQEPGMDVKKAKTSLASKATSVSHLAQAKQAALHKQSKEPLANAVARDDAMIAAAKEGVEQAEKKLIEEEALHARVATMAIHHKRRVMRKAPKATADVAAAHVGHRTKVLGNIRQGLKASEAKKTKVAKKAPSHLMSQLEKRMLSAAMKGALEAGLLSNKSKAKAHEMAAAEEKSWKDELSKWGFS